MDHNDAFFIHRGFMCDLASQSKAIEFLLSAVGDFGSQRTEALQTVEELTPDEIKSDRNAPKRTKIFKNPPDELIHAAMTADHMWHAEAIYSGTLFVVLSSWIQTFGKKLGLTQNQWLETGETIAGRRISRIIWAAANNFRHFEEWTNVNDRNRSSIDVLQDVGVVAPWDRNVTGEVLKIVNFPDQENVWNRMHVVANELFHQATGRTWSLPHY